MQRLSKIVKCITDTINKENKGEKNEKLYLHGMPLCI